MWKLLWRHYGDDLTKSFQYVIWKSSFLWIWRCSISLKLESACFLQNGPVLTSMSLSFSFASCNGVSFTSDGCLILMCVLKDVLLDVVNWQYKHFVFGPCDCVMCLFIDRLATSFLHIAHSCLSLVSDLSVKRLRTFNPKSIMTECRLSFDLTFWRHYIPPLHT